MYKEKLVFSLKCPKHKSFTPLNGQQSIKGGCFTCQLIFNTFKEIEILKKGIKLFKEIDEKREN